MAYDALTSGDVDANSPADTTLWTKVKNSLDWLRGAFDASTGHKHTGAADDGPPIEIAGDQFEDAAAGDYQDCTDLTPESGLITSGTYTLRGTIKIARAGTYRIKWQMKNTSGSTVYGKIYRNGSPVGTEKNTNSTTYVTVSDDISGWSAGDTCELWSKVSGGNGYVQGEGVYVSEATMILASA
jgi:hypothetical protein